MYLGSLLEVNKKLSKWLRGSTLRAYIPCLMRLRKGNNYKLSID